MMMFQYYRICEIIKIKGTPLGPVLMDMMEMLIQASMDSARMALPVKLIAQPVPVVCR